MTLSPVVDRRWRARINKKRRSTSASSKSTAIIPGLPEDIALCILARLPRFLQRRRRLICHAWKDAMEAARMSSLRKALHISEEWPVFISGRAYLYANDQFLFTIVDPLERRRRNIPLPQELKQHKRGGRYFKVIGAIGSEVLIACASMYAPEEGAELQGVYSFNGLSMKWAESKYSALPSSLSFDLHYGYASAADMDGGFLYVAGGLYRSESVQGVVRLDTKTRLWETLPDPHVKRNQAVGFVLHGLFYLIGGWHNYTHQGNTTRCQVQKSGEIWDPANREWTLVPELWPNEVFGSSFEKTRVVALKDRLYALRRDFMMTDELMYYENVSKSWTSLGCVPLDLSSPRYHMYDLSMVRLLAMGEELWVIDRCSNACVAAKPAFSQPISWKTLPHTYRRALPIHWDCMVAALRV